MRAAFLAPILHLVMKERESQEGSSHYDETPPIWWDTTVSLTQTCGLYAQKQKEGLTNEVSMALGEENQFQAMALNMCKITEPVHNSD